MATVAIVLNTSKKLANEEYSAALRITNESKAKYFAISTLVNNQSLGFQCTKDNWKPAEKEDNGLGKFRKSHRDYKGCNALLEQKLADAKKILDRYDTDNISFSFEQFEADLKYKERPLITLLSDYYAQYILVLEEQQREGLAGLSRECKRMLSKFRPDALLNDVNFRFLETYEYWLRNVRKNKDTTISVKMRNLQRVINLAIEDKLFKQIDYPFGEKKYSINKRLDNKTKKIAIPLDKVGKLKVLQLEPGSALHFAQQLFLFSYYCRGMNFIDITYLKWDQISETHISYTRRKTRSKFEIPINQYNNEILTYFKANYTIKGGFVFPILDPSVHITMRQQYTRKKTALKSTNDNLKKLAVMIDEPNLKLTTNVGRHSYATGLKRSGANVSHIKESLGHATEFQTQTYLDEFEVGVIESLENKMFGSKEEAG